MQVQDLSKRLRTAIGLAVCGVAILAEAVCWTLLRPEQVQHADMVERRALFLAPIVVVLLALLALHRREETRRAKGDATLDRDGHDN